MFIHANHPSRQSSVPAPRGGVFCLAGPWRGFLVLWVWMAVAGLAHGAEVRGLYEASVSVSDRSTEAQGKALRRALGQVIAKVAGTKRPLRRAGIREALDHPEQYIEQFLYRSVEASGQDPDVPDAPDGLMFRARFDPSAIDDLLGSEGIPIWGHDRPSMLIWLVAPDGERISFVGENSPAGLSAPLYETAGQRGVPIVFPLLDAADLSRLDETDVRDRAYDRVLSASARYGTDTVLLGELSEATAGGGGKGRWELLAAKGGILDRWTTEASESADLLRKGVDRAADVLVERYGNIERADPMDTVSGRIQPTVSGIHGIRDYARTLDYLDSLWPGTKVYVRQAVWDRMSFELSVPGGEEAFARMVESGGMLFRVKDDGNPFLFRLR